MLHKLGNFFFLTIVESVFEDDLCQGGRDEERDQNQGLHGVQ